MPPRKPTPAVQPPPPAGPAARSASAQAANPPICQCGPLVPLPGEQPIPLDTSGDAILSQIQLELDKETGVFFFRSKSRLYLRVVKVS